MSPLHSANPDLSGLSDWASELAQTFVALASDIALVIDHNGVIRDVAQGSIAPVAPGAQNWVGRSWADTATGETRSKIEQLLGEVSATGLARRREINHPLDKGGKVAVAYTAIRLGSDGMLLAVGRDLGAIAAIEQRFLDAQQEMERSYWRARHAEARYRLLFQVATDAVLVVDAHSLVILEANQSATQLFDLSVEQMVGRCASFGFDTLSRGAVDELLVIARSNWQAGEIRARLAGKIMSTSVAATPFRTEEGMRLLIRVRALEMPGEAADLNATLARLVDSASDGVVVTDSAGRILLANPAFLKLVQMNTEVAVKGRPLMDWIGVSDEQFSALLAKVRNQGITRRVASRLLSSDARVSQVEMSAALLAEGDQECIGFTIHFVGPSTHSPDHHSVDLHAAVESLGDRVGSATLPELLRQAGTLLERHFIGIALANTNGDATAAAKLLGISRERLDLPSNGAHPPTQAGG